RPRRGGEAPGDQGGVMLAVLVPSRGRPHNLRRLAEAIRATATGDVVILSRLDDDDPELAGYATIPDVTYIQGPRIFYGASVNELAQRASVMGATHLAMFGDDVV